MKIPEIINNYNVYNEGAKVVGLTGQFKLPSLDQMTETISGAGILGEYDAVNMGAFSSLEVTIPYRNIDKNMLGLENITLRASLQDLDSASGKTSAVGVRVVMRGKNKGFDLGTVEGGKCMNASSKLELFYLLVEVDGQTIIELDKLNFVYIVNGEDKLKKVRDLC